MITLGSDGQSSAYGQKQPFDPWYLRVRFGSEAAESVSKMPWSKQSMHMKRSLPVLIGASALFILAGALAAPIDYLFRDDRLCDTNGVFCFRGTLSYRSNPRLLDLRARVQTAPGPGLLRIRLAGANQQGHRRFAPFEVRVRGRHSEIINHQMIPDHPDVPGWVVEKVEFIADQGH